MTTRGLLRLDALYCAVAGAVLIVLAAPLAHLLGTRPLLLAAVGCGSLAWAAYLRRVAPRAGARSAATIAGGNLVAAAAIAALAAFVPLLGALLLAAVALEVGGIGAAQLRALRS